MQTSIGLSEVIYMLNSRETGLEKIKDFRRLVSLNGTWA
jgi:hypothetical protein